MSTTDERLNKLEGRIEGMSHLLLQLTARLEMNGTIKGLDISNALRRKADSIEDLEPDVLAPAKQALVDLAQVLDDARAIRQKRER